MTNTSGTVIPALSQNDTNTNPHNPMYAIYQYGARGGLLNLVGVGEFHVGRQLHVAADHGYRRRPANQGVESGGYPRFGQHRPAQHLAAAFRGRDQCVGVDEAHQRRQVGQGAGLCRSGPQHGGIGPERHTGLRLYQGCLYRRDVQQPGGRSIASKDPKVVGPNGIFNAAEFQSNSDYQKTAAIMKLVIDGNAAAGTIEMGGFDYHSGNRMDGEARDLNLGNCIGACLEYAARVGKPVMIYVFSDGSLASNGMIDTSVGGRGKGVWTADNQSVAATYFLVYNPKGKPVPMQSNPEMSLQIGSFNADGSHQYHRQSRRQQRS